MPRKPKGSSHPAGSFAPRYIPQHRECIWEALPIPNAFTDDADVRINGVGNIFAPLLYVAWSPKSGFFGVRQDASGLAHFPAHFSPEQLRHVISAAELPGEYAMVLYVPKRVAGNPRPVEVPPTNVKPPPPNPVCGRIGAGSSNEVE